MAKSKNQFLKWFGPVLDALRDLGDSGRPREVTSKIAQNLKLPDSVIDETRQSGVKVFYNQVAWARQYLVWEGLLDSSKHGTWKLTEKGRTTHLNDEDARNIFLKWVSIYQKNRKKSAASGGLSDAVACDEEISPENEHLDDISQLIDVLRRLSPVGFEKVCKELLRESGFENVEVTGGSADGGIDGFGILELNPFVSFKVLFQCKRYKKDKSVSRAQVGDFRNAMIGRAEKGIIITTSYFSSSAIQEAKREGAPQIELVDGERLVRMFEKVELGLKARTAYDVDYKYFDQFK
jgi:restriction system protein